jgi:hypothetical protein
MPLMPYFLFIFGDSVCWTHHPSCVICSTSKGTKYSGAEASDLDELPRSGLKSIFGGRQRLRMNAETK